MLVTENCPLSHHMQAGDLKKTKNLSNCSTGIRSLLINTTKNLS